MIGFRLALRCYLVTCLTCRYTSFQRTPRNRGAAEPLHSRNLAKLPNRQRFPEKYTFDISESKLTETFGLRELDPGQSLPVVEFVLGDTGKVML